MVQVVEAHLEHNTGGMFDKMDPFVIMKAGPLQEWRSAVCHDGGKNPRWMEQRMGVAVTHLGQDLELWVRNHSMMEAEAVGHARVHLGLFKRAMECEERVPLMFRGMHAGHIILRSRYHPEEYVEVVQQPMMG